MPSREELNLRANAVNVAHATYANDSKLEQAVIYAEKNITSTATATTVAPSEASKAAISGGKNV